MCTDPLDHYSSRVVRHQYFHAVSVSLYVENDLVVPQKTGAAISVLDILRGPPPRCSRLGDPVADPFSAVSVGAAKFIQYFSPDNSHPVVQSPAFGYSSTKFPKWEQFLSYRHSVHNLDEGHGRNPGKGLVA